MFLKRNKPRSPAKRWEVLPGNDVLKKTNYKKFLNKSTRTNFENKKTKRKRLVSSKTQFYYLHRGVPISSFNSRINFVAKLTYANFFKASIEFKKGSFYYIKAPSGYRTAGYLNRRFFLEENKSLYFTGDSIPMWWSATGSMVYSLKVIDNARWRIAEAAGTFCKILWHEKDTFNTAMNLPSKKFIRLSLFSDCMLGRVSNRFFKYTRYGNAKSAIRKKKKILRVRGIAMNPVDHPNGGRANTKQPLKNPWGKIAKRNK